MTVENLISKMWRQYIHESPDVLKIYNLFLERGEKVVNDHIAIRTLAHHKVGAKQLARFFTPYGYKKCGSYKFEVKKLDAIHLEHEDPLLPKIFISELRVDDFSYNLRQVFTHCLSAISDAQFENESLLYAGALWKPLAMESYRLLQKESEYAAWLYAFGFRANHFTVSLNHLKTFDCLDQVNQMILESGFSLNDVGGVIKGTPGQLLEQSSTNANKVEIKFTDGNHKIPNSYYEFARRYPREDGSLFNGFVTTSADKIFESTHEK